MQLLEERIRKDGIVKPGNILQHNTLFYLLWQIVFQNVLKKIIKFI